MARPLKEGLDYFTLDCHMDNKIQLIEAEFGIAGFAVIIKLFQKIYGEHGYYCEWNEEVALLFAKQIGAGCNVVLELVNSAIKRGIFDNQMFKSFGILTSRGIQKRYIEAAKRRTKIKIDERYLLLKLPKNEFMYTKTGINATETQVFVYSNPQSKVNNSKVYSSKRTRNRFNDFQQRDNDVENMENSLITNSGN